MAAKARGEPIGRGDEDLCQRYEQDFPDAAKDEAWLWAGIGALGEPRGDEVERSDAALVERVLARAGSRLELERHAAPEPRSPLVARRPLLRRGIAGALAAGALAAAFVVLAAELLGAGTFGPSGVASREPAPSAGAAAPEPSGDTRERAPPEIPKAPSPPAGYSEEGPSSKSGDGQATAIGARPRHPHEAREGADDLLKSAQTLLGEGRTEEAVGAYKLLLSRYPSSAEARAALISLGRLSLGGGSAEEALGYFDRYLAGPDGPLRVEARYGRIQALRRLGRTADERSAIHEFLARHSDSVYAPRLLQRIVGIAKETHADPPVKRHEDR
jgi:tetratricopeptide (TPR) repeat protein